MLKNEPVTALLIRIVSILFAKFEVSSFNHSGDIRGCQNSKSGSRDSHMTSFDQIVHFFIITHCRPSQCQIRSF